MDANTALTQPYVCGLDLHDDGSYGVRFRVDPAGPFPGNVLPGGPMSTWDSAAQCTAADWAALTADELATQIAALWANVAPTYAPVLANAWSDGQVFAASLVLTSSAGGFGDVAHYVLTETDGAGALVVGTRVAEVLDPNHLLLSEPAAVDSPALAFSLAASEEPAQEPAPELA